MLGMSWMSCLMMMEICGAGYTRKPSGGASAFNAAKAANPNAKLYPSLQSRVFRGWIQPCLVYRLITRATRCPNPRCRLWGTYACWIRTFCGFYCCQYAGVHPARSEVAFTEIDIRKTLPATAALLAQQKADYQTMVTVCIMVLKCVGIIQTNILVYRVLSQDKEQRIYGMPICERDGTVAGLNSQGWTRWTVKCFYFGGT